MGHFTTAELHAETQPNRKGYARIFQIRDESVVNTIDIIAGTAVCFTPNGDVIMISQSHLGNNGGRFQICDPRYHDVEVDFVALIDITTGSLIAHDLRDGLSQRNFVLTQRCESPYIASTTQHGVGFLGIYGKDSASVNTSHNNALASIFNHE